MAEKKQNTPKNAAAQKNSNAGQNDRAAREMAKKDREDKKKRYLNNKLRKASQDDYEVISRRTDDTNDFIGLLNSTDNLVHQMRRRMDRQENLTAEVVSKYLKRYQAMRADLDQFNKEVSELLGFDYVSPRGLNTPPKQSAADNKMDKAA